MANESNRESIVTCPQCGHCETGIMPDDACIVFFECRGCGALLRPKPGDCCVYCSYGSVPCPPRQSDDACCAAPREPAKQ